MEETGRACYDSFLREAATMEQPVAVITGAGRGIGRATAVALARLGYHLGLVARSVDELEETARLSGGGLVCRADVSRAAEVERAVAAVVERFGRVDAAIHCAGVAPVRGIAQMSADEWREVIDTNLSAAFYLCKAVWPAFERQGGGVVVNVSSQAARDPFPGFAAYGAAKAGVNLFGLSAAREGEAIGVRVHTVAPAAVETEMFRKILSREQYPTEKTLAPEDVAKVIVQCVTGELKHTSGEVIYIHKV
ncbi:MAG: putative oxidoreductase [Phycisphaerales bacterium]|nr:putative oxidoreductase [Phycisphaerales bacterium]